MPTVVNPGASLSVIKAQFGLLCNQFDVTVINKTLKIQSFIMVRVRGLEPPRPCEH